MTVAPGSPAASDVLLIQFARSPQIGSVKTRLVPALGEHGACELHCELVEWTCRTLVEAQLGEVEVHIAGTMDHALFRHCRTLGAGRLVQQRGANLGERMHYAIAEGLARAGRVVLVGSDCPSISRQYLADSLGALERAPLVLGPAMDGGYVLIGARHISTQIFAGVNWGSGSVLAQTKDRLQQIGWDWATLDPLPDIDRPDDLFVWQSLQAGR